MHISEGVLSAPVLLSGAGMAALGTGVGLKKIKYDQLVHVAILSSAFFAASLIHVNIGPATTHLILNGLLGLILGVAAFPAILAALVLQSLLFQFGGITVLGVNVLIMAAPAVLVHHLFGPLLGPSSRRAFVAGFFSGSISVLLSALLLSLSLWLANAAFLKTSMAIFIANLPVMVIEGIVTGFCVSFLFKVYPEILPGKTV